ncbi:MAG: hypothetical protein JSS11_04355 [Verrucomicrobia bacterium]|nr:hypothetical protein [Verrucomicrobiota bacterium]
MSEPSLQGWTPLSLTGSTDGPAVDWCNFGPVRFTDSFFEQTAARALRNPARQLFRRQTGLEVLEHWDERVPSVRPTGFIYHLSRCGSTLAAQMLAASPRNIALSEPIPFDQVLSLPLADDEANSRRIACLRGVVHAMAQPRAGETRCFIKVDSWHTHALPLIHAAFPDVPWIFLYRDPVEVLVSHHRQRGGQMIPGLMNARLFGLDPAEVLRMSPDEYCAHVLASISRAVLRHAGLGHSRFINYRQLPGILWESLGDFFGAEFAPEEIALMREASCISAKQPHQSFAPDAAEKQSAATEEIRRLAATHLAGPYAQMEALRAGA